MVANAAADAYWAAAAQSYSTGDYAKTVDQLDHLLAADNPSMQPARWTSQMGDLRVLAALEEGARVSG